MIVFWSKRAFSAVAALGLVAAAGGDVQAAMSVTYSDSGHFTTDVTGPNSVTIRSGNLSVTIAFEGVASHSPSAPDDTLGTFSVTAIGGSANVNTTGRFFLDISQTAPLVGNGFFSGTLAGSVKFSPEKNAVIEFDETSLRIPSSNGVTYTLLGLTGSLQNTLILDTPVSSGMTASTLLRARIDDSGIVHPDDTVATPEPASLATAGLGVLMGLGYAWRRKRAAA